MAVKLKANQRQDLTKSYTKQVRQAGQIPAVVYGKDNESKTVSVDSMELLKTLRDEGRNSIISLNVEGDSAVDVMLHDYQTDPIKDELIHADFFVVNMSQEMDVEVPIRLEGEAQGSKDGGVLQQPLYNLAVRAKPADIPEEISINISELGIGDTLTVSDLKEGRHYEIMEEEDTTIVTISAPDAAPSEDEAEEAGDAEQTEENAEEAESDDA
ncbi:50S ribosomal protein L25/general stress protein Ctc [Aquibacillus sediminis]|uniref:50S ribosomal protein L25/general stress protein Ctc n=1 Tax=Aquibacillus sediminis TaxID=2574734 RepID=UPI0011094B23|nr:50S ribosomal protein L25/general stress protein Ctc [Aquibacillus sediminis]